MAKSIGKFISSLRKANGYTQESLAEVLGVSNKTISSWETDKSSPDLSILPILADLFHVSCDELLRGERIPNSKLEEEQSLGTKTKNLILKRILLKYRNMVYISVAIFLIFLIFFIVGFFLVPRTLGIVFLVLSVCIYIGGIVFSYITYTSVDTKVLEEEPHPIFMRYMLKYSTFLKCLYSLFLFSSYFCYEANKKLKMDERYKLNQEELQRLAYNFRLKKIMLFCFVGMVLVLFSAFAIYNFTPLTLYKYTKDEIKEQIYDVQFNKKEEVNLGISFENNHYNFSVELPRAYQDISFPETYVLDIFFGSQEELSSISKTSDSIFTILYHEETCDIYVEDFKLFTLYQQETKNKTVYFAYKDERLIEDFNKEYYLVADAQNRTIGSRLTWFLVGLCPLVFILIVGIYFLKRKRIL